MEITLVLTQPGQVASEVLRHRATRIDPTLDDLLLRLARDVHRIVKRLARAV